MGTKISVQGLITFFSFYLSSAMVRFPLITTVFSEHTILDKILGFDGGKKHTQKQGFIFDFLYFYVFMNF